MIRTLRILFVVMLLAAGGCARALPEEALPAGTQTPPQTQITAGAGGATPAAVTPELFITPQGQVTPSVTLSASLEEPGEPADVLFSAPQESGVYDVQALLQIPIPFENSPRIDPSYRYASTQNGEKIAHDGIEFYNEYGTPVLAARDGVVLFAGQDTDIQWGWYKDFYGNLVILQHEDAGGSGVFYTLYAHLSEILVQEGQAVQSGQRIGSVGMSGTAYGSHLHFELRFGQPQAQNTANPELFLSPALPLGGGEAAGILAGQLRDAGGGFVAENGLTLQPVVDGVIDTANHVLYFQTYIEGYPPLESVWGENFGISGIPAGAYRLSSYIDGRFVERFIEVRPGKLTYVILE